jgi:hypothetical protein
MNDNKMSKNPKKENKEINGIINGHNKKYIFDNKTMDFGEYLKLLKINPFDKVTIIIKKGSYNWNELYTMPQYSEISIYGEGPTYSGDANCVSINFTKDTEQCFCSAKEHFSLTKLILKKDCLFYFNCIDLFENIIPPEKLCKSGFGKSLFILAEDNSNIYFLRSNAKINSSPFINVVGLGIGKITFERTKIKKDENSNNEKLILVGTIAEGSLTGNKVIINTSFLEKDEFCLFDEKNSKIEYKSK